MRTPLRASVAFVACVVLLAPAAASAQKVPITPGSAAHQNVETAIKFLRDHGETTAADEIQKSLDDGDLYSDQTLGYNGETENLGDVKIDASVLGHNGARDTDRVFDPANDRDYDAILGLARTLYHENIHKNHQNWFYWTFTAITEWSKGETDAWSKTLAAMERWVQIERDRLDVFYNPKPGMTPAEYQRELKHLRSKIQVLTGYYGDYKNQSYFPSDEASWVDFNLDYWKFEDQTYLAPKIVRGQPSDDQPPTDGGAGAAPGGQPATAPPPTAPNPPAPTPTPVATPPPCEPCRPIAAAIAQLRARLQTLLQDQANANEALDNINHQLDQLRKRAENLNRELQRSAGTGGSSYDPATGTRIDAYDQGDGTVRVTTRDANGNVIDDHVRDSSARKAELRQQLDAANAEIDRLNGEQAQAADAAAKAGAAVEALTAELQKRIAELAACIAKNCSGLSVAESLHTLGLPFPSLDVLANPFAFSVGGATNGAFQTMIIELRVKGGGVPVPAGGRLEPPSPMPWLDPRRALAALARLMAHRPIAPTSASAAIGVAPRAGRAAPRASLDPAQAGGTAAEPPVQIVLTSLGSSTGQAFDLQVVNDSGRAFQLDGGAVVVEPLADAARRELEQRLQRAALPRLASVDGYCLDFAKLAPSAGMAYRLAPPAVQARFEPVRRVLDAGHRLQESGLLHPDSDAADYGNFVRQWAVWSHLAGWGQEQFTQNLVERTRKNAEAVGQTWSRQFEDLVRQAAPNRWRDVQAVLDAAR